MYRTESKHSSQDSSWCRVANPEYIDINQYFIILSLPFKLTISVAHSINSTYYSLNSETHIILQLTFQMLGFTHTSNQSRHPTSLQQMDFQPIIIPSTNPHQKEMPEPKKSSKRIIKAHSNYKVSTKDPYSSNAKRKQVKHTKDWSTQYFKNKQGVFDRQIKKDSLASQERRERGQIKKMNKEEKYDFISKEEQIFRKRAQAYEEQKDRQIEQLKKLIEKEKNQKQRNDRMYELKKQQIEKERLELLELEKRIQKQGPKAKKQHQQKLKQLSPEFYPGNDRAKCHQDIENLPKNTTQFAQITQSQSIANQKNQIRQKQLSYLIQQREKNHLQYQRNTLGYTPTLIPLLSRASYKIISTHVTSLVELFIDDLLEEQVHLLSVIEMEEAKQKEANKEKQILHDYINNLEGFVEEAEDIEYRVGRYSKLKFEELYKPQSRYDERSRSGLIYSNSLVPMYQKLQLNLSYEALEQLDERVKRFHRFVSNFAEYKPEQLKAMKDTTQQVIDDMIMKIAQQLDNGSGEFVNIVFRGEFQ